MKLWGYLVKKKMLKQNLGFTPANMLVYMISSSFILLWCLFQEPRTGWYRRSCPFTTLFVALATAAQHVVPKPAVPCRPLVMTEFNSGLSPRFDIPGKVSLYSCAAWRPSVGSLCSYCWATALGCIGSLNCFLCDWDVTVTQIQEETGRRTATPCSLGHTCSPWKSKTVSTW